MRRRNRSGSSNPHIQRALAVAGRIARPCWACGKYLLPLVLLAALASSIFYVRILYGPISLKVLAAPIARSIAAEIPALGVSIEDALVRLNEEGELEFRLRNVRLLDTEGSPVAVAPLAALALSLRALWSARLSPEEVVLIEPRLLLTYSAEHGLSFSFTRPADTAEGATSGVSETQEPVRAAVSDTATDGDAGLGLPVALRQLDLARVIADTTARARQGADAASFLRKIGLRDATLIFDRGGEQRVWRIPHADVALSHGEVQSLIEGSATVETGQRPWTLRFWSEASGETEQVSLKASVRDVVPSAVADALPPLDILRALSLPASGDVTLEMTSQGELLGGSFSLDLARGDVRLPWLGGLPLTIESGNLDLRYDPGARALQIEPSTLAWGQSRVTITGQVASQRETDGGEVWIYKLSSVEGRLAPEATSSAPVAIESWRAEGSFRPETGAFTTKQTLNAGGGELHLAGEVGHGGSGVRLEGHAGAMPVATVMGLWPRALGRNARIWVRDRITEGQILGGSFRFVRGRDTAGRSEPQRLSVAVQAADLLVRPGAGLPSIEVPRALIRLEGSTLEVTVPEAAIALADRPSISLQAGRFTAVDLFSDYPTAQIAFRGEGSASAVVGLIEQEAFGIGHLTGVERDSIEGKVEAELAITLPLPCRRDGEGPRQAARRQCPCADRQPRRPGRHGGLRRNRQGHRCPRGPAGRRRTGEAGMAAHFRCPP